MDVGNQRHVVSIDVLIGDQDRSCRQFSGKKNRLTILMGCNNKYPSRVSIRKCQASSIESMKKIPETDSAQKYYFQRKNKKQRKMIDSGLTERKLINGVTTSLCRGRQASKSYRIHTIDYIEQNDKKDQNKKYENNFVDLTKRKNNFVDIYKNKIKKKSIINQSDFTQFNTILKSKKDKEGITLNLKHRKLNKAKTEFEEDNLNIHQVEPEDKKKLMSQRKLQEENLFKKIQFKKNKIKNIISSHSQRDTIQMKIQPKERSTKQKDKFNGQEQIKIELNASKKQKEKHQNHFYDYLDFIEHRKKKQIIQSKCKGFRETSQDRSLVMKSTVIRQTICLKLDEETSKLKQNIKPTKVQTTPDSQKLKIQTKNSKMLTVCQPKFLIGSQQQCSTIQQINQSSFLSQTGKKQIITTTAFQLLDTNNPHTLKQENTRKQGNIDTIQVEQSPKRKKRKKQSKMSVICRSEVKQMFPDRFFG